MSHTSHTIITDDPRLSYSIVSKPKDSDLGFLDGSEGCGICTNEHAVALDKYDYLVPLSAEYAAKTKHTEPLPLSFLQIKEGDVEAGILWYKQHYPKVPDDLIEIMARYNFGDLKYATRKSIKNNAKRYRKKHAQKAPQLTKGLTVKHGPVVVTFD